MKVSIHQNHEDRLNAPFHVVKVLSNLSDLEGGKNSSGIVL
jgi:hypothetical protein